MVLGADGGERRRVRILAGEHQRRIARQEMLQRKDDDRQQQDCRNELREAAGDQCRHGSAARHVQANGPGFGSGAQPCEHWQRHFMDEAMSEAVMAAPGANASGA